MSGKKLSKQEDYPSIFGEFTQFRHFSKNAVILPTAKVESYVSFVHRGTVGIFIEKDETEICHSLIFENEYFSSYESFVARKPSVFFIKALDDLVIASISYKNMQLVLSSFEGLQYGKQIADQLFFGAQRRIISFLTQSAEERYHELIVTRPHVVEKIKQKYIASYLGVTPVSLSRIRAQSAQK